ncbi:Alpha/Beta hydrolase protein [Kockovaella imperatae]|uniref:Alpha/Beta hydrolase protein n=1 Tax=Kockovaella imperatae TaxID=4999 RepID=A0A1Y1UEC6_9TREE|nr:Alpha/Beta hydrolase protein [Kockovaella imperatae]ORX36388.1 Alpha/Beta hydrolase protein [Kockovaella imperatae]
MALRFAPHQKNSIHRTLSKQPNHTLVDTMTDSSTSACCNLPPVEAKYTNKGEETQFCDIKTYITGPKDAKEAIFILYDVFGMAPQTLQAADLLASQGFRVYVPDLLMGEYVKPEWYSGSEEGNQKRQEYFSRFPGSTSSQSEQVSKVITAIKAAGQDKIGLVGLCWGWKAAVLAKELNQASALAGNHPSMTAKDDVEKIDIPVLLQPSKNEDAEIMKAIYEGMEKKLPGKNKLTEFPNSAHGWTAARADLESEEGRKTYSDAWSGVASFFKTHLSS